MATAMVSAPHHLSFSLTAALIRGVCLLHSSAARLAKCESKFKSNAFGFMDQDSCEKRHKSYLKRQERAESKRMLLKWRCLKISPEELGVTPECKNSRFSKMQFPGWSFRIKKEMRQRFTNRKKGQQAPKEGETFSSGSRSCYDSSSTRHKSTKYRTWSCEDNKGGEWWCFFGNSYTERGSTSEGARVGNNECFSEETLGSPSDRRTLGLPPFGPLTLEELKHAFRVCALKWHPDRHEGDSKVDAEKQFKNCGAAYKALHAAVSPQ